MKINITDSAISRVAELIKVEEKKYIGLRVSVEGGGCSGFMYNYELIDATHDDDTVIGAGGIKIVIDPVSETFLEGCTVDFVQELGSSYFQVKNPKAAAKCGCGNSFAV